MIKVSETTLYAHIHTHIIYIMYVYSIYVYVCLYSKMQATLL